VTPPAGPDVPSRTDAGRQISVVIPTRDRPRLLAQSLESVRRCGEANPDLALEIIVVNDGAADGLRQLTGQFGARLLPSDGHGPAAARNTGMNAARGQFLAFLDDDDAFLATHLRPQIEALEADPSLMAAFGQIQLTDPELTPCGEPGPPSMTEDPLRYLFGHWHQIGAVVARSEVRETVGPFDTALVAGEEQDWLFRLFLRHPVAFVGVPSILFRQRPVGTADRYFYGQVRFARRNFWTNVRRAGPRRPHPAQLARIYLRHNGHYAGHLLNSAESHASRKDPPATRFALRAAFLSSPPHVALALLRRPGLIPLFAGAVWSRQISPVAQGR
jgi:glycosyltransferase involved in cell wall biosynthesis